MKTWMKVVLVVLGVACITLGWLYLSTSETKSKAVAEAKKSDSIAVVQKKLADANYNDAQNASSNLDDAKAELDTIRPVAAKADSLIKASKMATDSVTRVNNELQKKLAEAIAKAGKVSKKDATTTKTVVKGPEAKKVLVAKLKGHPIINASDSTFTYAASDSTLIAKLAPAGFRLIKKPR